MAVGGGAGGGGVLVLSGAAKPERLTHGNVDGNSCHSQRIAASKDPRRPSSAWYMGGKATVSCSHANPRSIIPKDPPAELRRQQKDKGPGCSGALLT